MKQLPKRITLQRIGSFDDAVRAFAQIERAINELSLDGEGNIVSQPTNSGGTPGSLVGPQGPQGPAGARGATGATGPMGPAGASAAELLVEELVSFTVPSAAPGVWSVGSVAIRKKALLYKVSSDQSCIVRLYFNEDVRDSDIASGRIPTTAPSPGIILAEVGLALSNMRTQFFSPVPSVYNADDPRSTTVYYAVQQTMLAPVAVNIELTILPLEI